MMLFAIASISAFVNIIADALLLYSVIWVVWFTIILAIPPFPRGMYDVLRLVVSLGSAAIVFEIEGVFVQGQWLNWFAQVHPAVHASLASSFCADLLFACIGSILPILAFGVLRGRAYPRDVTYEIAHWLYPWLPPKVPSSPRTKL